MPGNCFHQTQAVQGQASPRRWNLNTGLQLGNKNELGDGWKEQPSKVQKSSGMNKPLVFREEQGGSSHTLSLAASRQGLTLAWVFSCPASFIISSQWPLLVFSSSLLLKCQSTLRFRTWLPLSASTALVLSQAPGLHTWFRRPELHSPLHRPTPLGGLQTPSPPNQLLPCSSPSWQMAIPFFHYVEMYKIKINKNLHLVQPSCSFLKLWSSLSSSIHFFPSHPTSNPSRGTGPLFRIYPECN